MASVHCAAVQDQVAGARARGRGAWHRATRVVLVEVGPTVTVVTVLRLTGWWSWLPYAWLKLLHIVGAVLLVGNIVVTALWLSLLARSAEPGVLQGAARATLWADVRSRLLGCSCS